MNWEIIDVAEKPSACKSSQVCFLLKRSTPIRTVDELGEGTDMQFLFVDTDHGAFYVSEGFGRDCMERVREEAKRVSNELE